jgi:hypothetical protein
MATTTEKSALENIIDGVRDITNPEITTVIEFDNKSTYMLGAVLLLVLVLAIIAWAVARKMSNPK